MSFMLLITNMVTVYTNNSGLTSAIIAAIEVHAIKNDEKFLGFHILSLEPINWSFHAKFVLVAAQYKNKTPEK